MLLSVCMFNLVAALLILSRSFAQEMTASTCCNEAAGRDTSTGQGRADKHAWFENSKEEGAGPEGERRGQEEALQECLPRGGTRRRVCRRRGSGFPGAGVLRHLKKVVKRGSRSSVAGLGGGGHGDRDWLRLLLHRDGGLLPVREGGLNSHAGQVQQQLQEEDDRQGGIHQRALYCNIERKHKNIVEMVLEFLMTLQLLNIHTCRLSYTLVLRLLCMLLQVEHAHISISKILSEGRRCNLQS